MCACVNRHDFRAGVLDTVVVINMLLAVLVLVTVVCAALLCLCSDVAVYAVLPFPDLHHVWRARGALGRQCYTS